MNDVDCIIRCDVYLEKFILCSKNVCVISFHVLKVSVVYRKKYLACVIAFIFSWMKDKTRTGISQQLVTVT